ncbi:hypothetical protein PSHT_14039 [Puccinia striiformis]|uniref:Uncharacterized protein n=1 Tax=Puccinia striiformis TaxID=27350 RepID=A0A2S4UMM0_9BASI|nr:hypothetical protein PSHT_14039 [Puccinia striiformis]
MLPSSHGLMQRFSYPHGTKASSQPTASRRGASEAADKDPGSMRPKTGYNPEHFRLIRPSQHFW